MPLKKNDNDKKIKYKLSLLIVIDLCQLYYQILLITYQGFMIKNVKNVWKEKKN